MAIIKICFELDEHEDAENLRGFLNVNKYYFALDKIYNDVRNILKYSDEPMSDRIEHLLESIQGEAAIIHEDG